MKRLLAGLGVLVVLGCVFGAGAVSGGTPRGSMVTTAGVAGAVALVLGINAGAAWAKARRGYDDWRTTRRSVPGLRKAATSLAGTAALWAAGIAVAIAVAAAAMGR